MMNQKVKNWYLKNIKALMNIYGYVQYDEKRFSWIYINDYILPGNFNQGTSALLLTTPKEDLMIPRGFAFFLNQNLRRTDGKPTSRLHDYDNYNPFSHLGYTRICLYIDDFRPQTDPSKPDNLIDLCQTLYNFLGDKTGIL